MIDFPAASRRAGKACVVERFRQTFDGGDLRQPRRPDLRSAGLRRLHDVLDLHEGSWEEVQRLVANGEQARAAAQLPFKLAIADQSVAMVSLTLEGERVDALVTESPPLVDALRQLFEFYWRSATPVAGEAETLIRDLTALEPRPERVPTPEEHAMLTLIGAGLKDEVIARQLDMSVRTLRRRSQDLMAELGAANRFQAGAEAARRGWL